MARHSAPGVDQPSNDLRLLREQRILGRGALFAGLLLFLPLLIPLCTGRVFVFDDLSAYHLPLRQLYANALEAGDSILWTPYLFNGFYVHAEGQHGGFHPLHLILYRYLPLGIAFNLELLSTYVAAFAGMLLFLRRVGLSTAASAVGGTAFAFCGFNLMRLSQMNVVAVAAHIPWLLFALETVLGGPPASRPRGFVALALLVASQVLLGFPQAVWMSAVTCAVYTAVRVGHGVSLWRLPAAAGGAVLGLAMGGVQLLPTLDHVSQSLRAAVPVEFFLTFSLHPLNILQLWSPYVFQQRAYSLPGEHFPHEFVVYSGALSLLALFWGIARWRQVILHDLRTFAVVLAVLGLALSLGRYSGLYQYLSAVPVIGTFRGSARHLLLFHVGLSILVALFYEDLIQQGLRGRSRGEPFTWMLAPAMLSVITALAVWFGARLLPADIAATVSLPGATAGMALTFIAALLVSDAVRGARLSLLVLPFFAALDLGVWGYGYTASSPARALQAVADLGPALPPETGPAVSVHLPDADASRNLLLLRGARLFWGYVGLFPSPLLPTDNPDVHRLAGVEWIYGSSGWRKVPEPMPRVRVLSEVRATSRPDLDLGTVDISRTALAAPPLPVLAENAARATLVREGPGWIDVRVDTTGPALLALTERYHEGWVGLAGERSFRTLPLYGDFLGVLLEPGVYDIALRFRPASVRSGIMVSSAGLLAMLAVTTWMFGRARGQRAS